MLTSSTRIAPALLTLTKLFCVSCCPPSGVVGEQQESFNELPLSVWFIWIPQLLASLHRAEGPHIKPLLAQLATSTPQVR